MFYFVGILSLVTVTFEMKLDQHISCFSVFFFSSSKFIVFFFALQDLSVLFAFVNSVCNFLKILLSQIINQIFFLFFSSLIGIHSSIFSLLFLSLLFVAFFYQSFQTSIVAPWDDFFPVFIFDERLRYLIPLCCYSQD